MPSLSHSTTEEDGVWPVKRSAIIDWLVNETRTQRFIDNIWIDVCERLKAAGVPIVRASLHLRVHHPQWLGARILWRTGMPDAKITMFSYGMEEATQFLNSPVNAIYGGLAEVRQTVGRDTPDAVHYPISEELREKGLTDYIAWPIEHTLAKRHVVTFATDRRGGFTPQHVEILRDILPALSLVTEIRLKNILARTFLETYVGPHASEAILAGATTRGSGATVSAAIMICDLRDFTALSDLWPRDDVIDMLNAYFDALSEPIEKHGGEILKFMGDGLLAIFPLDTPTACADLLVAIRDGQAAMAVLNALNVAKGRPALSYGVGVHVGDVMYGNIGSRKRLDFTVIGPAVNVASRLETLTKEVRRRVLLSKAFLDMAGPVAVDSLGFYPLKGLGEPVDVFALRDEA